MKKELLLFQRSTFRPDTYLIWRRFQSTKPVNYDSENISSCKKVKFRQDSCRRYLNAVQAVVSETEFKESEKVVKEFLNGEGLELHKELLAYDKQNKHTSYISKPWFDLYLESRVPVPVNYNPFMMFAPDPDPAFNNQLVRATNFVLAMGRFKKSLDAECLAPEVFHLNPKKSDTAMFRRVCRILPSNVSWFGAVAFKAFPLDMSQYPSLFGGNRIPQKGKDRLHLNRDSRHFLVARNGNFYTVDLFDSDGKLHRPEVVHGYRDTWAHVRQELMASGDENAISLRQIDDALFLLCLDDLDSKDPIRLVGSLLCGDDGSYYQLRALLGDGVAVLRLMEETLKDSIQNRFVTPDQTPGESLKVEEYLQKLDWSLSDSIRQNIQDAQQRHLEQCKDLQFGTMEYTKMNRDTIKGYKLSPDSMMQLAIQMAFYGTYKEFVPTYESCSTAAFFKGRTECVRSATIATREAVLAMETKESQKTKANLYELFKKCSDVHSQLVKEGAMGQGFDRHLLGLKITAKRLNRPLPTFLQDKTYEKMNNFVLSTSTLSTDTIVFGGFGPVVPDGFGIGYNVVGSKLGAVVSSYKSKRDANKFCESLANSLDVIKNVLETK
uniref:Choline/carnitine acyltransferase domain-containing protein n=1 Tax=Ditylenchus dipsaci TaxID=166011 RepID=A0A915ETU4_9BILA